MAPLDPPPREPFSRPARVIACTSNAALLMSMLPSMVRDVDKAVVVDRVEPLTTLLATSFDQPGSYEGLSRTIVGIIGGLLTANTVTLRSIRQ